MPNLTTEAAWEEFNRQAFITYADYPWLEIVQQLSETHEALKPYLDRSGELSNEERGVFEGAASHYEDHVADVIALEVLLGQTLAQERDAAEKARPAFNQMLEEVAASLRVTDAAAMVQARVKNPQRIQQKFIGTPRLPNDVLAGTLIVSDPRYVIRRVLALLEEHGYTRPIIQNYFPWGGGRHTNGYMGINITIRRPDGHQAEVQIHTPETSEARGITHDIYVIQRESALNRIPLSEESEAEVVRMLKVWETARTNLLTRLAANDERQQARERRLEER